MRACARCNKSKKIATDNGLCHACFNSAKKFEKKTMAHYLERRGEYGDEFIEKLEEYERKAKELMKSTKRYLPPYG